MASVLRQLQAEWNALVPAAQARGIRRVKLLGQGDILRAPLETIAYRRAKLEWLRSLLGGSSLAGLDGLQFGVEIEVILPRGMSRHAAAAKITAAGVECHEELYGHSTPAGKWKVVTDGSLGYDQGAEFVSPPLRGEEGFRQMRIVCDALTAMNARITSKCGFHVHVDVGTEPVDFFKNLVRLYASAETTIDKFMPASRRGSVNPFCQPTRINDAALTTATNIQQVATAIGQDNTRQHARSARRYRKLNLQCFFVYGTVEFRQHGGTCDAQKAANWVRLCLRMVLTARAGEKTVTTVDELLETVGADEAEKAYFSSRVNYFNRAENFDRLSDTNFINRRRPV
jgi:hypothetical protein